jgi:poly(3-hydroxybutyrate) depolymerase
VRQPLDGRRAYATGLSNGAMMAWRLTVEASEHIAVIALVALEGSILKETATHRPFPVEPSER